MRKYSGNKEGRHLVGVLKRLIFVAISLGVGHHFRAVRPVRKCLNHKQKNRQRFVVKIKSLSESCTDIELKKSLSKTCGLNVSYLSKEMICLQSTKLVN